MKKTKTQITKNNKQKTQRVKLTLDMLRPVSEEELKQVAGGMTL